MTGRRTDKVNRACPNNDKRLQQVADARNRLVKAEVNRMPDAVSMTKPGDERE